MIARGKSCTQERTDNCEIQQYIIFIQCKKQPKTLKWL